MRCVCVERYGHTKEGAQRWHALGKICHESGAWTAAGFPPERALLWLSFSDYTTLTEVLVNRFDFFGSALMVMEALQRPPGGYV